MAYVLTLLIETIILFLILRNKYPIKVIIVNSLIANTLTHPMVWFIFPLFGLGYALQIAASEIFAFVVEAILYLLLFEKVGWLRAVSISLLCNLVSFLTGVIIYSLEAGITI